MKVRIDIHDDDGACECLEVQTGGRSLAEVLAAHGKPLNTRCGHRGLCQGCEIEFLEGTLQSAGSRSIKPPQIIRACQVHLDGPASIRIPAHSRMEHRPQVSDTFRISVPYAHQPRYEGSLAFAVDVGTTTVALLLLDLENGEILARASGFNGQIRFGDNVLTRIDAASTREGALGQMQQAVVRETIDPLLRQACERAGRSIKEVAGGTVAGNTTMLHLLMGEDPSPLGVVPFTPRFIASRETSLSAIGMHIAGRGKDCPVFLLPGIGAYIGADIVAGIFATGMAYDKRPSLLVDVGTNGEIVLQNEGRLFACATAAGPAFEGSGLRCGARAREGAISDIRIDGGHVHATAIGNVPASLATGICGSAYINFLAEARRCGLLQPMGRLNTTAWQKLPAKYRNEEDDERAVCIAGSQVISEVDVALLLQAKAAIGAGIETLLEHAGIAADALGNIYLAGGFGMHLHVADAIQIGLLQGMRTDQVQVVGNTSLAGAMIALLDRSTLPEMEAIRSGVIVLELNLQQDFEERFIDHLLLP